MERHKFDVTRTETYPPADTLVLVFMDSQQFALREMRCDVDGIELYDEDNIFDDSGYEIVYWWDLPEDNR